MALPVEEMTLDSQEAPFLDKFSGKKFVLLEASAGTAIRYRNANAELLRYDQAGNVIGWKGGAQIEADVVAECLCEADEDYKPLPNGKGYKLVSKDAFLGWPDQVQKRLFERLKEISPSLAPQDTEESLRLQIDRAQHKLDALLAKKGVDPTKPPASAGPT